MSRVLIKKEAVRKHRAILYRRCLYEINWQKQADIARQIANLPERKDNPGADIL